MRPGILYAAKWLYNGFFISWMICNYLNYDSLQKEECSEIRICPISFSESLITLWCVTWKNMCRFYLFFPKRSYCCLETKVVFVKSSIHNRRQMIFHRNFSSKTPTNAKWEYINSHYLSERESETLTMTKFFCTDTFTALVTFLSFVWVLCKLC